MRNHTPANQASQPGKNPSLDLHQGPQLETARLRLRPWRASDHEGLSVMMADADVARYITLDQRPMDPAQCWRQLAMFVGHWHLRGFGMFVVEEKASGAFVGRIGPWMPHGWPAFEVGWGLGRAFWGKGYATEAAAACLDWAFDGLKQDMVSSLIHVDNLPSQRVAERLGEHPAQAMMHAGMPHTLWQISRADWAKHRGQFLSSQAPRAG